jgi:hypothetical protein
MEAEACFGSFRNEGSCDGCPAALWCEDFTRRLDEEAMACIEAEIEQQQIQEERIA